MIGSDQNSVNVESAALPRVAWDAVVALCAAKLLLHIFTSVQHYGYFRDELYNLDLARHLAWGYVDCAPLIAVYAKIALLMGGSLAALRILPALAGTALVALGIFMARELGGGRYAQWLTGLAILLTPAVLALDGLLTMNAFEPLYWMGAAWVIMRLLRTGDSRLWIWFGVLMGLGLENKHSTLFFGFAVFVALLLTKHRREFLKPWIWIGAAIILILFAPNLIWQVRHHFPTYEDLHNVKVMHKNVVLGEWEFVKQQILIVHPLLFPVWLAGLVWMWRTRRWRVLAITFAVFFVVMEVMHAKVYYVFPIYGMMFAAGSVAIAGWIAGLGRRPGRAGLATAVRLAIVIVLIVGMGIYVPLTVFALPPEKYLAYGRKIGYSPPKMEMHHESELPQPIADQFGWREMVAQVAELYDSLPAEQRAETGIIAGNYGEAGAVDEFGSAYGLPTAISGHQNHFYWGPPAKNYENFIVIQWDEQDVKDDCTTYRSVEHYNEWGMGEENRPIFLCMGAKFDLKVVWGKLKHWN